MADSSKDTARFLRAEPPKDPNSLNNLFVDRETELELAVTNVSALTRSGQDASDSILAVCGLARVGKSHFMLRLLERVTPMFSLVHRQRVPQGITDPVQVMRQLVRELTEKFDAHVQEHSLGNEDRPALAEFDETWRIYGDAIEGRPLTLTNQQVLQRGRQLNAGLKANGKMGGLLSRVIELGAVGTVSAQQTDSQQTTVGQTIQVPAFTTDDLCDLVALRV